MNLITDWFRRTFSNPQVVILATFILVTLIVVIGLGKMLAPVFAALIIAYLLEGLVQRMVALGLPRLLAVLLVFIVFLAVVLFLLLGLSPVLSRQLTQLVQQIPNYINQGTEYLRALPENYPDMFSAEAIEAVIQRIGGQLTQMGQQILTWSVASVLGVVSLLIFLVLVPILVFFFLKDKDVLVNWMAGRLPKDRSLVDSVWGEVDAQIGNYVRGKALEILIVGSVTFVVFSIMGLQYAALLATMVGFSVLIPYIGAAVATVPVVLVALFQFGWSSELLWVFIAYSIIQALDGNVLVPLLFSEVVNLHPVAIIVAVLVFGGIWGFWGVFFSIPLATVVHAVIRAWPTSQTVYAGEEAELAKANGE